MGKKTPQTFPAGSETFGLLVTRCGGKHYPNALLELLFVGGQLVLLTGPLFRQHKGLPVQSCGNMEWRSDAEPLKAAGLPGRN